MRIVRISGFFLACVFVLLANGCGSELQDLKVRNATQEKLIKELEGELQATKLQLDQLQRRLDGAENTYGVREDALRQEIEALEEDVARKKELIARMQEQLLGGAALPVELSTQLEDFAKGEDMVTYDASRGIVKFKSDLLFEKGSAKVAPEAVTAVQALCKIMNSEQGQAFDIIVAGHTDDIPIRRAETRAQHPTNWHLSAHRAISVLEVMGSNKIDSKRMSVRGFSEFRPVAPNEPGKRGNPQNRRVEIYIVPEGM